MTLSSTLTGNEDQEKLGKMNKLMDILSNPNKRMPMETLLKCEAVLEKMNLDTTASHGPPSNSTGAGTSITGTTPAYATSMPSPSSSGINPLLDAVIKLMSAQQKMSGSASPLNHTLHRTFAPLEALFGPEISVPPISEVRKCQTYQYQSGYSSSSNETTNGNEAVYDDIPDVLQGEVARLQSHFKVSLDPAQPEHNFRYLSIIMQHVCPVVKYADIAMKDVKRPKAHILKLP